MLPQIVLVAVAGILAGIAKLMTAPDETAQQDALMDMEEAMKKALDHYKFGSAPPADG